MYAPCWIQSGTESHNVFAEMEEVVPSKLESTLLLHAYLLEEPPYRAFLPLVHHMTFKEWFGNSKQSSCISKKWTVVVFKL